MIGDDTKKLEDKLLSLINKFYNKAKEKDLALGALDILLSETYAKLLVNIGKKSDKENFIKFLDSRLEELKNFTLKEFNK